ncbi:MAG: 23S rRNA (uracil(747)-C(5))-methyltransferase RlmC [Sulfuricurvum sp.]|jgi:23S rRNA (uracil747-C5)-methyltransferase|uniref:23S rRNA (uracil(747)-C(5))-methyltransferase RlmC n=1 Tax=Sulfuricurvum sp. TaxID=2025608 RepID=UPI0025F89365|nr:23S rRNA (uracil(747)-C(5))-methyltransferase RlmC [Sulfuricurvum sp.]MCK9373030.1 23S rRNA (uracil(747)-C(5))-methyltransferase RlmC [Sulfuricurvum sp.]
MGFCRYYDAHQCRSCTWIDLPYAEQLARKSESLHRLLDPFAPEKWLPAVAGPATKFRNKAKMVALESAEGVILGINEEVSLIGCPLYDEAMQHALSFIQQWLRDLGIKAYDVQKRKGELKYVLLTRSSANGTMMLRFVLRSHGVIGRLQRALDELMAAFSEREVVSVNIQPVPMAILEGEEEIFLTEKTRIEERLGGIPLFIRPKSFFQTNPEVAGKLYKHAAEWIDGIQPKTIWDLFCGVGGFALHCAAPEREIIGIEIESEAIACARDSAKLIGFENIRFEALDAVSFSTDTHSKADVIIVNPPRRGIGEQLCEWVESISPSHILYSSCNALTLAKDLERLSSYRCVQVQLFDMFPHTEHYEVLLLLEKR